MELKIIDGLLEIRAVNADKRSVDAVMSTEALDRYNERILHDSWKKRIGRFESSPVLLKDHDHTKPIGHWENVRVTDKGLVGTAVFATTPDAEERFALHRDGHVKSFSVGFIPHQWRYEDEVIEGKTTRVKVYQDCELLECSSVAVGANPDVLQRLMRMVQDNGKDASIEALVSAAVRAELRNELQQIFHAGPGGLMTTLAQDIAELVVCGGPGMEGGDIPDLDVPDPEPVSDGHDDELKAALLDTLGKAE